MHHQKLIWLILILNVHNLTAQAQEKLPPEAAKAVKTYESKIKKLAVKRLQARTELEEVLLAQQQAALTAGDTEAAQRIERKRSDLKTINDRVELHDALVGHTYKWEINRDKWTFNSDGTITANDAQFPWVTLNGNEVLLTMKDGSLRILQFNEERTQCRVAYHPPTKPGENTLKLIK